MVTDRKEYARDWRRRRRDAALAVRLRTAQSCPHRLGKSVCGGKLHVDTDDIGRTIVICDWCQRRKAGLCRYCPKPVYGTIGRTRYCRDHRHAVNRLSMRASEARHHEERRRKGREHYNKPEVRARRNEYRRLWRLANPDKVRAQKLRYVKRHAGKTSSKYERYHRRYRKKHGLYYRQLAKDRAIAARRPAPPCTDCGKATGWTPVPGRGGGRPWSTCMRCAWPHQRKERRKIRRDATKRIANDPSFGLKEKLVRIRKPERTAVRGPGFERLCVTPGCDIVVTHRKKKCTRCRRRDAELAVQRLERQRGRGRRTDLEQARAA